MKVAPAKIGFDFDCVVADTMEAFIRLASEDHGLEISPEEITDFMVAKCLAIDLEIIDAIFARLVRDPLGEGLKPMTDAIAVLEELAAEAPLTFITARPDLRPVAAWLERHLGGTSFARLRLVATGDHDNKGPHIKALGLTHFVDDRAGTCRALAGEEGITPIVYEQPWNSGRHELNSVVNWADIKKICG